MELGLHLCSLCCDWTQLAPYCMNCSFTLLHSHCFIWCFSESFLDWHILTRIPVNDSCSFTGVWCLRSARHKPYYNDSYELPYVSGDELCCIFWYIIIEEHISKTQSIFGTEWVFALQTEKNDAKWYCSAKTHSVPKVNWVSFGNELFNYCVYFHNLQYSFSF